MRNIKNLWDIYQFSSFRVERRVAGVFGDPYALVLRLQRRGKKRFAGSAAVRTGVAENHLTVIANGTTFTFLVNGTQVTEITDSSFSSGRVGVAVTAYADGANIHESFDNLTVRELK